VAHTSLRREMDDLVEELGFEQPRHRIGIGDVLAVEAESVAPLQLCEACFLELRIVVAVDVIDADDLVAAIEKALRRVEADESRSAGNQEFHASIILPLGAV